MWRRRIRRGMLAFVIVGSATMAITATSGTALGASFPVVAPTPSTPTLVNSAQGTGRNQVGGNAVAAVKFKKPTAQGDFLVAMVSAANSPPDVTLTDNAGNTWTETSTAGLDPVDGAYTSIWFVVDAAPVTEVFATAVNDGDGAALAAATIDEFTGVSTNDPLKRSTCHTAHDVTLNSSRVSPRQDDLVVASWAVMPISR